MPRFTTHEHEPCGNCGFENGELKLVGNEHLCFECAANRRADLANERLAARRPLTTAEAREMLRSAYRSNRTLAAVGEARGAVLAAERRALKSAKIAYTANSVDQIIRLQDAAANAIARCRAI